MLDDIERGVDRSGPKLDDTMKRMRKFIRDTEETKSESVQPFDVHRLLQNITSSSTANAVLEAPWCVWFCDKSQSLRAWY